MLPSVTAVFLQSLHVHPQSSPRREKGGYKLRGLIYDFLIWIKILNEPGVSVIVYPAHPLLFPSSLALFCLCLSPVCLSLSFSPSPTCCLQSFAKS